MEMWSGGDELPERIEDYAGKRFSMITKPFVNVRNTLAAFGVDEENKRKDLKGTGFLGPLIDNLPYFRRSLPDYESPTSESPIFMSEYPAAQWFPGVKLVESESFAGREWRRLGLKVSRFLEPSPNAEVNRAQSEYFSQQVRNLGKSLETNAYYKTLDNDGKAAIWEYYIRGNEMAEEARERGLQADPIYQRQEEMKRDSGQGPLQRKASGLDEQIKGLDRYKK
jgi:hypothetical protein